MEKSQQHDAGATGPEEHRPVRMVSAKVALAGAVVIALLTGAAAAGVQTFSDVPTNHPFHDEIEAIAAAGITTGFNDGTYRPGDNVTRGAMAAFMGRGFGRAGYEVWANNNLTEITSDGGFISLPYARLVPGAQDGSGYAVVTATVEADRNSDTCPCASSMFIQATRNNFANNTFVSDSRNVDVPTGVNYWELTITTVIPVESVEEAEEYRFRVRAANDVTTLSGGTNTQFSGSLSVVYVPFGFNGNQTLGT